MASILLSTFLAQGITRVSVECGKCPRRGSYDVRRAIEQHGDITAPAYLTLVSGDCPRRGVSSFSDWCGVVYGADSRVST